MPSGLGLIGYLVAQAALRAARAVCEPGLTPSARLAWVTIILALPGVGLVAYFLFGEIRMARAQRERIREIRNRLNAAQIGQVGPRVSVSGPARPAFAAGQATSQFPPVSGNKLTLLPEGDAMMDDIIDAIGHSPRSCSCAVLHLVAR